MKSEEDILAVTLAVVRGMIPADQARTAILARTTPQPVCEALHLAPTLIEEARHPDRMPAAERDACLALFRELYSQPEPHEVLREDEKLAAMLAQQALVAPEQADECLATQRRLAEAGVRPLPRLGELLVRKGYLTPGQRTEALTRRLAPGPLDPAAADPAQRIGKYVRVEQIGKGGMGEVWKAWDTELRRWVALKFPKFENAADLDRLSREALAVARLSHPNIAAVYDLGQHNGRPFIAMQYVDGVTLADLPRRDVRRHVESVRQAALAIAAAHAQGIVHRDLKPANIMLDSKREHAYVMDFGIARQTSSTRTSTSLIGTPAYMSPEQARGERVDGRSDIWSLGVTLYELLTGELPFAGDTAVAILEHVAQDDPRPAAGVEKDLRTLIFKCLEKDLALRYATAQELADDLGRWLRGEPIRAHPPSVLYRARKAMRRHRAAVAVGAAGLALALAVAGWAIPQWIAKERELARERRAAEEREKALRELGALWSKVLLAKQGFYNGANDPAVVRDDIERAVGQVGDYIRRHPDHPQGYYVRARGWLYVGRRDRAEADLQQAMRLAPDFAPGYVLLAQVKIAQSDQLRYGSRDTADERNARSNAMLREAVTLLGREEARAAERLSMERWGLISTREDEVAAVILQARTAIHVERKLDQAEQILRQAHAQRESEEYCLLLALLAADDPTRIKWLNRAIELMPLSADAHFELGLLRQKRGEDAAAIADYTRSIAIAPHNPRAYTNRGMVHRSRGNHGAALEDLTRAVELDPRDPMDYINRAEVHADRNELDAALADLTRAIELAPNRARAYAARSGIRLDKKDVDGAMADASRAIELAPDRARGYHARGDVWCTKSDFERGLADFTRAIELDPTLAESYAARGSILKMRGDLQGALKDYLKAVELGLKLPANRAHVYDQLAAVYRDLGDRKRAIDALSSALQSHPRGVTYQERGRLRKLEGQADGALADFTKAIELGDLISYHYRGELRMGLGDHKAAIEDFSRLIERQPDAWFAYGNRADARRRLGDFDGAIADLEQALQIAPAGEPGRAELEKLLAECRARRKPK